MAARALFTLAFEPLEQRVLLSASLPVGHSGAGQVGLFYSAVAPSLGNPGGSAGTISENAVITPDTNVPVSIPDANLAAAIHTALGIPTSDPITQDEMAGLNSLYSESSNIQNLTGLQYATNLQHLDLASNQISDLSPLAGLTSLQQLDLSGNQISDISPLAGLTNLQQLQLYNNQISDISPLAALTSLQQLSVANNQVSDLTPLSALTSLQTLDLSSNQITNLSPLSGLTDLQDLYLYSNQIKDITALAALTNLEQLSVANNQVSDITPLSALTNLQQLDLDTNQVSDLSPLAGMSNLQTLYLYTNQISNLSPLMGITSLQFLWLDGNQISNLSPLAGLTNLQQLDLDDNQISNITALDQMYRLIWLHVAGNQVNDLTPLDGLSNLQTLDLDNNQISSLAPLAGLSNLQTIDLESNQISDLSPLAGLSNVQMLDLNGNQISNFSPLSGLSNLQVLDLESNQISSLSPLARLSNLQTLDLIINQITDLTPLAGLSQLQYLYLAHNKLELQSGSSAMNVIAALQQGGTHVYDTPQDVPTLTISTMALTLPATTPGAAGATTTFTVTAGYLTHSTAVLLTAPVGSEISLSSSSGFAAGLTLHADAGGNLATTTIYACISAAAAASVSGNISVADSADALTQNIAVTGALISPVAAVTGHGQSVPDHQASPSAANATDFGSIVLNGATVTQTYTIANSGSATLTIPGAVTAPSGFIVTQPLSTTIAPDGSTTFTVSLPTGALGAYSGSVTIPTNDSNNNPYTFNIAGAVVVNTPLAPGHTFKFVDSNGSKVTVSFTGKAGMATISRLAPVNQPGDIYTIALTGTNTLSALTITATGGSDKGLTTIGQITADSAINRIMAKGVNITGAGVTFSTGYANALTLHDLDGSATITEPGNNPKGVALTLAAVASGATITLGSGLTAFTASDWSGDGQLTAPWVGSLKITGDKTRSLAGGLGATLTLTGDGAPKGVALGSAAIIGNIAASDWTIHGSAGAILAFSTASAWNAAISGVATSITTRGNADGTITAASITTFKVGGNMDAHVTLTIDADASKKNSLGTLTVTGTLIDSSIISAGSIGNATFGAISQSNILVGMTSAFQSSPAVQTDAADYADTTAKIARLTVKGITHNVPSFTQSLIAAAVLGTIKLQVVDTVDITGSALFGIVADKSIASFSYLKTAGKTLTLTKLIPGDARLAANFPNDHFDVTLA